MRKRGRGRGVHSPGSSTRESFIRISGIFPYSRARDEWDFSFLFPNFFFISCSTSLSSRRRRRRGKEGPIGSSCHSLPVTYECRKFSTDASLPPARGILRFYRPVKSLVIPRFISGNIYRVLLEIYWIFFSFFRSKGNVRMMEELIFLKNRNEIRREN